MSRSLQEKLYGPGAWINTQEWLSANTRSLFPPYTLSEGRLGQWLSKKARRLAKENGYQAVAKNLRKQGMPFELAYMTLFGKAPK